MHSSIFLAKNWNSADACTGKWQGITCKNRRLLFVSLSCHELRGPIDPLSVLDQLWVLDLQGNRLNGSMDPLSNCYNLKLLYLASNDYLGLIPADLAWLRRLVRLDTSDNNLRKSIPPVIQNLTRLVTLRLQNNILSGSLPDLNFLGSNNELSGQVPCQLLEKFQASAFAGNAGLCGRSPFPTCTIPPPGVVMVPSNPSFDLGSSTPVDTRSRTRALSTGVVISIVVEDDVVLILITLIFSGVLPEEIHQGGRGCWKNDLREDGFLRWRADARDGEE